MIRKHFYKSSSPGQSKTCFIENATCLQMITYDHKTCDKITNNYNWYQLITVILIYTTHQTNLQLTGNNICTPISLGSSGDSYSVMTAAVMCYVTLFW